MVISRTKYAVTEDQIRAVFRRAGLGEPTAIRTLGAGEFNAVFAVEAEGTVYALKVGANNDAVQIYEKDMMKSEVYWYDQMAENTAIRVPKIYYRDFSRQVIPTNYFIMEFIPGLQKDRLDMTPAQRQKADAVIASMMAQLHRIPGPGFGYIQTGLQETWYLGLKQILRNLEEDARLAGQSLPRLEKLSRLCQEHRQILESVPCRLISFDAWDPNFICTNCDPEDPEFAWIDPERCLWADPVMDFITLDPEHWRLEDKTAAMAAYNRTAEFPVTATREQQIRYGFGLCYLGAIMECERFYRYTPDLPCWERNLQASDALYTQGFSLLE